MFYTIYAHQRKIKKYQSHKNVKCIWKHYTLHIKSMFPNFWYLLYLLAKKSLSILVFDVPRLLYLPKNNRSTSKIVEWEKKKRAKRTKNVLQCPMC